MFLQASAETDLKEASCQASGECSGQAGLNVEAAGHARAAATTLDASALGGKYAYSGPAAEASASYRATAGGTASYETASQVRKSTGTSYIKLFTIIE